MKKTTILILSLLTLCTTPACSDRERPISADRLPAPARQLVGQHFSERKIALVKKENEFLSKSYEVIFADGDHIDFDRRGNWQEIDCKFTCVPAAATPLPILEYVETHYPEERIVKIERDRREYEVKLTNRMELSFDRRFNLTDIDR